MHPTYPVSDVRPSRGGKWFWPAVLLIVAIGTASVVLVSQLPPASVVAAPAAR